MIVDLVATGGKKERVQRTMRVNCAICKASLACQDGDDIWVWAESAQAAAFLAEHRAHGNARTVSFEIVTVGLPEQEQKDEPRLPSLHEANPWLQPQPSST